MFYEVGTAVEVWWEQDQHGMKPSQAKASQTTIFPCFVREACAHQIGWFLTVTLQRGWFADCVLLNCLVAGWLLVAQKLLKGEGDM